MIKITRDNKIIFQKSNKKYKKNDRKCVKNIQKYEQKNSNF